MIFQRWVLICVLAFLPFLYIHKNKPSSDASVSAMKDPAAIDPHHENISEDDEYAEEGSILVKTTKKEPDVKCLELEDDRDYILHTFIDGVIINTTRIPKVFKNLPRYVPRAIHYRPAGFTMYETSYESQFETYDDEFWYQELLKLVALVLNTLLYNVLLFVLIRIISPRPRHDLAVMLVTTFCLLYVAFYVGENSIHL